MAHSGENSTKVIFIALLANLGIAVAKFIGAFFTKSASMLAEAIHSVVDSTNQVLLLVGAKRAAIPPSDKYPLGHGREAFFWSFVVAILLFSLGGLFAIYEGVHKLTGHEQLSNPLIGLAILTVSILLESYSFYACIKEVRAQNTFGSLWTWLRRTTSAELLVVFTEDFAALTGLIVALLALIAAWVTGNPVWDAVGSIVVGAVLVIVAVFLAVEIKSLLVGEAPSTDFRPFLDAEIGKHVPGARVLRMIALQLGASEVLLSTKISAGTGHDVNQLVNGINSFERAIKVKFPQIKWSFVEPDTEA